MAVIIESIGIPPHLLLTLPDRRALIYRPFTGRLGGSYDRCRRRVLDLPLAREHTVAELVEAHDTSQPAVSKRLRLLRDAGPVETRVDAQRRVYRLYPEPLAGVDAWLQPHRRFWRGRLASLQRRLASDD